MPVSEDLFDNEFDDRSPNKIASLDCQQTTKQLHLTRDLLVVLSIVCLDEMLTNSSVSEPRTYALRYRPSYLVAAQPIMPQRNDKLSRRKALASHTPLSIRHLLSTPLATNSLLHYCH